MIFSSQLKRLDGLDSEQALKTVSNHLRKMQEELEYRLSVLDSSNINEIDADQTNILTGGKNINNVLADQEGNMSKLTQTVEGFATQVKDYEGKVAEWQQTVEGFTSKVSDYENGVSQFTQTVEGFTSQVTNYESQYSSWQQTVDGFNTQVSDYAKGYSSWEQTVEGFATQIKSYEGQYSTWQQTVAGFQSQVRDYETGYSSWQQTVEGFNTQVTNYTNQYSAWTQTVEGFNATVGKYGEQLSQYEQTVDGFRWDVQNYESQLGTTLTLDENGVYITDYYGNVVSINGGQIEADTVVVSSLYGDNVYLKYGNTIIGDMSIAYTTSGFGLGFSTRYGGIRLSSAGNVSIEPGSGYYVGIGSGGRFVSIQSDLQPSGSSYSCGTSNYPWSAVYASTGEISTSDREKKNSIDYDTEKYEKLFDGLKPCSYKMNDGTSDRRHVGLIAQDVEEALEDAGLSTQDFAGFVKAPRKDEDGNVIEGEYDLFLRYSEFMGMCIAEIQKLKARVEELERKEQNDGQAG